MHYYQHNIGDYRRDTSHLSLLEHGIYRTLLDLYYLNETPIPKGTDWVIRRLSAKTNDEILAIQAVLKDFFVEGVDGYTHKRCDMEIREYTAKAGTARINGKLGGRPKKTQPVILGNQDVTQVKANHEPLTINHKPKEERGARASRIPADFEPIPEPEAESGIDRQKELSNFRDYWTSKARDNTKLDWQATWRQWARKADRPGVSRFAKPAQNITVPSRQERDPELTRLDIERTLAVPMPQNIREQMQKLKFGVPA